MYFLILTFSLTWEKLDRRGTKGIRGVAKKYRMTKGTLKARIKSKKQNKVLVGAGRSATFSKNTEEELKKYVGHLYLPLVCTIA